ASIIYGCETDPLTSPRQVINRSCYFQMSFPKSFRLYVFAFRNEYRGLDDQNQRTHSLAIHHHMLYSFFQPHLKYAPTRNGLLHVEHTFVLFDDNKLVSPSRPATANVAVDFTLHYSLDK